MTCEGMVASGSMLPLRIFSPRLIQPGCDGGCLRPPGSGYLGDRVAFQFKLAGQRHNIDVSSAEKYFKRARTKLQERGPLLQGL